MSENRIVDSSFTAMRLPGRVDADIHLVD